MRLTVATVLLLAAASPAVAQPELRKVATFDHQVTGVAVTPDGRVFVNFPRWTEDSPISVAEVKKTGEVVPYPDEEWNRWRNAKKEQVPAANHWVCVQSVVADTRGNLWVLDPAAPANDKVVPGGPKLVQIDLKTNKPTRTIAFSDAVAPQGSYLNDVRFSPDGKTAYLTDSGAKGALVVVDLTSGKSRRVLDGDPSTQHDPSVTITIDGKPLRRPDGRSPDFNSDGIALSPDGKTLYYQALRGKTLYRIPTSALTSPKPEAYGDNGPSDGLWISAKDGRMYISSMTDNAIKVRDLTSRDTKPTLLIQDARLRWPDSFAEAADGTIYVTTSHIQDSAMFKPSAPGALTTELWSFTPATQTAQKP